MASSGLLAASFLLLVMIEVPGAGAPASAASLPFNGAYNITWGEDHVKFLDDGEVQLSLDTSSGSGFASRSYYGSGRFDINIKVPNNSAGVVTTYYLISPTDNTRDELDFEILGNDDGSSMVIQTNVIINGVGGREQRMNPWFDPTQGLHNYTILWNYKHIVFYVDEIPIRIFSNKTSMGGSYPSQSMQITASIWDGSAWATEGGLKKVDWRLAPFTATYRDFSIDGACPSAGGNSLNCYNSNDWWSRGGFVDLPADQLAKYEQVRKEHLLYDYCNDRRRYPDHLPPECPE